VIFAIYYVMNEHLFLVLIPKVERRRYADSSTALCKFDTGVVCVTVYMLYRGY